MSPIKVMHVGLGPIGAGVVRQVADRKGFRIVGAADIDPLKAERDLGEVAGVAAPNTIMRPRNAPTRASTARIVTPSKV
jgi:hypothetical protein